MAEEIRRRVAALRLAALLAVAVTLAGLTARDAPRPVSGRAVPQDSVGSRQVINKSLKAQDLKPGVALSPARAADLYLKISAAAETYLSKLEAAEEYLHKVEAASLYLKLEDASTSYLKLEDAAETYLKLDAAADFLDLTEALNLFIKHDEAESTYLSKVQAASDYLRKIEAAELYVKTDDAAATYLKLEDAAQSYLKLEDAADFLTKVDAASTYLDKTTAADTYIKQGTEIDAHKLGGIPVDGFVQGAGSVESGLAVLGADGQERLLELAGLAEVVAVARGREGSSVRVVNTGSGPLLVSYGGTSVALEPDGAHEILIGLNQPTLVQLVATEEGGLATLTVAASELGEQEVVFTGQALVGTP